MNYEQAKKYVADPANNVAEKWGEPHIEYPRYETVGCPDAHGDRYFVQEVDKGRTVIPLTLEAAAGTAQLKLRKLLPFKDPIEFQHAYARLVEAVQAATAAIESGKRRKAA